MERLILVALAWLAVAPRAWAENKDDNVFILNQVGKDGNYCISYTTDEKGCISGSSDAGETINYLRFQKGKTVVFRNLSDAPHDMRFTGANAEDIPAQPPNGADAQKKLGVEDPNKNKITCSFHGDQLSVGYRVVGQFIPFAGGGHKEPGALGGGVNLVSNVFSGLGGNPVDGIRTTGLADVSREVLSKGRPADVQRLVTARPQLLSELQQVRPLLAKELIASGVGGGLALSGAGAGGLKTSALGNLLDKMGLGSLVSQNSAAAGGGGSAGVGAGGIKPGSGFAGGTGGTGGAASGNGDFAAAAALAALQAPGAGNGLTDDDEEQDELGPDGKPAGVLASREGLDRRAMLEGRNSRGLARGDLSAEARRALANEDGRSERTRLKRAKKKEAERGLASVRVRHGLILVLVGITVIVGYAVFGATGLRQRRRKPGVVG